MQHLYVDHATMMGFLNRLQVDSNCRGKLYLVGESIQVFEGWTNRSYRLEFTAEIDPENREYFTNLVTRLAAEIGVAVQEESPADIIPLPKGYRERSRPVSGGTQGPLIIAHFDPYSVSFRLITRGDEPDYRTVLAFLEKGWITIETMNGLLSGLLPQFNKETIAQDPAEFRRKYRGLLQMWRDSVKNRQGQDGQVETP